MVWLKINWRWAIFNLFALVVLIFVLTQGSTDFNAETFDPGLESGKWAIRFLLICLAMTPLRIYFGWHSAVKLRKSAGLWCFGFALVHIFFFFTDTRFSWLAWLTWPIPFFLFLGLAGLLILTALAITSNRWAMRRLRKNWKRLHRLVYAAGLIVVIHALLTVNVTKKMLRDPRAESELTLYLVLLSVLLLVRLPFIRRSIKQIMLHLQKRYKAERVTN